MPRCYDAAVLRRRYLYVLLFALPALLVSIIAAALTLAAAAGALWLFVFGDDTWPATANTLLGAVFAGGVATLWIVLLSIAWSVGKRQEGRPALNRAHVALAIGATVLLAAVIAVRLTGWSFSGARTDSVVCADFCRDRGFAGSGMPPLDSGDRTCSCYDTQGREAEQIDLSAPPASTTR